MTPTRAFDRRVLVTNAARTLVALSVPLLLLVHVSCGDRPVAAPHDAGAVDRGPQPAPPPIPAPDMTPKPAPKPDLSPPPAPDMSLPPKPDLAPPVPVDAAPLPPGCKLHTQGMPSSCKSQGTWTTYATAACQQMGLPVVLSLTFLNPCGPSQFSGVSATCCPASGGP
jgi:Copper-binding of amyloid precursor, CuBD